MDIPCIAHEIENLSADMLSLFYSILYNKNVNCNNKTTLIRIKRSIFEFSGFPFYKVSENYISIKKNLTNLQFPLLVKISDVLFGSYCENRSDMIKKILNFLSKPSKEVAEFSREKKIDPWLEEIKKYKHLKEDFISGKCPVLKLCLKRLTPEDILKFTKPKDKKTPYPDFKEKIKQKLNEQESSKRLCSVSKFNARPLKSFPDVYEDIINADDRIISLIHILLFADNDAKAHPHQKRCNILNFSGFSSNEKFDYVNRRKFLKVITMDDINKVCEILHLKFSTPTKENIINGILHFIKFPCENFLLGNKNDISTAKESTSIIIPKDSSSNSFTFKPMGCSSPLTDTSSKKLTNLPNTFDVLSNIDSRSNTPTTAATPERRSLKSFEKIRFKIQCATPDDLSELNDLLFVKPFDNEQIHNQILNFSGFDFNTSSNPYFYRKNLLFYMNYNCVKKISMFLNICDNDTNMRKEQLENMILEFLMDPKDKTEHSTSDEVFNEDLKSDSKDLSSESIESQDTGQLETFKKSDSITQKILVNNVCTSQDNSVILTKEDVPVKGTLPSHLETRPKDPMKIENNSIVEQQGASIKRNFNISEIMLSSSSDDEFETSIPLHAFVNHPSDKHLKKDIREIIHAKKLSLTMKELVNEVYARYPEFDIRYRSNFIKSKARHILSTIQST